MSPAAVLQLQRLAGNRAVGGVLERAGSRDALARTAPVQRVKANKLTEWAWLQPKSEEDRRAEERTTLLILSGQLGMSKASHSDIALVQAEIQNMLARGDQTTRKEINRLIGKVEKLSPDATKSVKPDTAPLGPSQLGQFKTKVGEAKTRIGKALNADNAIDGTFSRDPTTKDDTRRQAKSNLQKIDQHLDFWVANQDKNVRINKNKADYAAFNQNRDDGSILMLANDAFNKTELPETLVHEASHGRVGTVDHAYTGAPYFLTVPDEISLDNADHYAFAVQVANGERSLSGSLSSSASSSKMIDDFKQAKDLTYFFSNKVWMFLMWMKDTYSGKNYVDPETIEEHGKALGFTPKGNVEIRREHVQLLIDFFSILKGYLNNQFDFTLQGSGLKMNPKASGWKSITVTELDGKSVEEMSDRLIQAMVDFLQLVPDLKVVATGKQLFQRFFVEGKDSHWKPKQTELRMYGLLGGKSP